MKILQWIIGIVITLFILVVISVLLIVNFINPNDYREQINKTISEKIHKPFSIHGDINWVFFPSLGFKAQEMTVGAPKTADLYLQLNSLEINLKLLPLLNKKIAVNALHLDGVELVLPASSTDTNETSAKDNTTPMAAISGIPQLSLKEFSIKNGNILKQDAQGKIIWQIKNLRQESSNIAINNKFQQQVSFEINYPEKNISAKINYDTQLKIDSTTQTISLFNPKLTIINSNSSSFPGILNLAMKQLKFNLSEQTLSVNNFSGDFNQLNFSGNFTITNTLKDPIASGELTINTNHLRNFFNTLLISLPKTQSPEALKQFSLKTSFQYSNNKINLTPLKIELDHLPINGSAKSDDIKNLALEFSFTLPQFNLDNYLTPSPDSKKITLFDSQINIRLLPPVGSDKKWIASNISSLVTINKLSYGLQNFTNLLLQLDAKNQIFKFTKLHAKVWQGNVNGNAIINLQAPIAKFTITPLLQNIQIEELLKLIEPKLQLTGFANVSGTISSEGKDLPTIKQNLMGQLNIAVKNGVLHGIDAAYWLKTAHAILHKEMPSKQPEHPQTNFGNLTATLLISNGIINNQDLLIAGPVAHITGKGTINLVQETFDYHLFLTKTNEDTGQSQHDIIPLKITGTFDNPSFQLDMAALTKQLLKKELGKKTDKLLQKTLGGDLSKSPVGQQISNALGKLLG